MKRALAERAKQSGLPNGGLDPASMPINGSSIALQEPPSVSTSTSASDVPRKAENDGPPPLTISKVEQQIPRRMSSSQMTTPTTPASSSAARTSVTDNGRPSPAVNISSHQEPPRPSPRPSPRPTKKRQRESIVKLEEEDDEEDANASAFYLKHQNRALASELRSVKYQLSRLERERDHRRAQCKHAVENLSALQSIWTQLESALKNAPQSRNSSSSNPSSSSIAVADVPFSTGSGSSVELIDALMSSLSRLATVQRRPSGGHNGHEEEKKELNGVDGHASMDVDDDGDEDKEGFGNHQMMEDVSFVSKNINERAAALQKWIWTLLQRVKNTNGEGTSDVASWSPPSSFEVQEQLTILESKNAILQEELIELARSKDEIAESDRRVRRGLYRLAAGRMDLKEVLKAVAKSDDDKEQAAAWMETTTTGTTSTVEKVKAEDDGDDSAAASSEEVAKLKKQIADLQDVSSARDAQIQQLLTEREEQTKRINSLVLEENKPSSDTLSVEDVQKSEMFLEQAAKLGSMSRKFEEMNKETLKLKEEWAQALADAESSKNAMEDMQAKHLKRWAELAEEHPDIGPEDGEGTLPRNTAEEIATLQHKLTQAMESVRQAEATRATLNEAVNLNASLQAKVEEFKAKYSALQAEKVARSNSTSGSNGTNKDTSSSDSKPLASQSADKSDKSDRSAEKLQRDYKRARKELAAAQASKEAAKAKLERAEKEREFLNQMNSRLLKQASEKDEINAKSLSTILQLKQLTEQISKEKENLEQQVKSAEQVALAARLASNARERLSEEFDKERKRLEGQVKEWEERCALMASEKNAAETKLLQEKSRMSGLVGDAEKAKERCEELVTESTKLQEEKQAMMESLAVAQREASEAAEMSHQIAKSSGGLVGGFTAEQLHTQVNVLKSRLACPVCNARDKKCILIRCRHMFCKDCVEENIKNRSRKCPACGIRFDTKDVADVWL